MDRPPPCAPQRTAGCHAICNRRRHPAEHARHRIAIAIAIAKQKPTAHMRDGQDIGRPIHSTAIFKHGFLVISILFKINSLSLTALNSQHPIRRRHAAEHIFQQFNHSYI
ncbi:hypothetical protein ACNRBH_04125 [Ralstonia pseudosolanacearum]|uniref:hypothetical protein n=1 Tax=Ralstonia pseudosolanacearum TaxID=1310165 RepID=UPI00267627B9|nr:hypothetical protein [Ralstonia pseudosolanacearum]MDO3525920.1 hypothetical protein [Ralstonia pseudosolanacearum]MDO3531002.1 hypothetical protein [Ralstonia pseudosolanacearum]